MNRDKQGRFAKQPAPKFQVGDLVDCDYAKREPRNDTCVAGVIKSSVDPFGYYRVDGLWKIGTATRLVHSADMRPHVPAPKAEPVPVLKAQNPFPGTAASDALEAAKRDAVTLGCDWLKEGKQTWWISERAVEIGFRAGQKAGGDVVAALESKRGEALSTMGETIVAAKAKWEPIIQKLDAAIAILKGGE